DTITAFASLEMKNHVELMDAVNLFGAAYIGLELPRFVLNSSDLLQTPWVVPPQGPVGNAAPDPQGGHCVCAVAYDPRNIYVVTWGAIKTMSWPFYNAYVDEAYAVLSADFLKAGKTIKGFDLAQLNTDLAEIGTVPATRAAIAGR
ncbi:MAG TPA: hypothetical protein VGS58_15760, partial [Candidatus Sulfopaludibacter sp.]|nr:hypothetical protein [Candidatus Sulfopaludibacter sp.]